MGFLDDASKTIGDLFGGSDDTATQTADESGDSGSWFDFDDLFGEDDEELPEGSGDENDLFGWSSDESGAENDVDGEPTAVDYDESIAAWASRQTTDSATQTALDCGYEIRNIILCNSIQFTRGETIGCAEKAEFQAELARTPGERQAEEADAARLRALVMPNGLEVDESLGEVTRRTDWEFEFRNDAQRVIYRLLVRETKDAFIEALQTEGAIVIYSGHSRYGRGPCFGASSLPGEDWEMGEDHARGGIFRMGYPIIAVHASEIASHRYSYYPVSTDDFEITQGVPHNLLHPDINGFKVWRDKLPGNIASRALSQTPYGDTERFADDKEVWMIPGADPLILLWAGWRDSVGSPHELDKVELKCRALLISACSTALHFQDILRNRKGWREADDRGYAAFTSAPATDTLMKFWLEALLNYSTENAFARLAGAMNHAKQAANKRLAAKGEAFRVV